MNRYRLAVFPQLALTLLISFVALVASAQEPDYLKTITDRSAKIVHTLGITDSAVYKNVLNTLVQQYTGINTIDEKSRSAVAAIKNAGLSKSETDTAVKKEIDTKRSALLAQHHQFVSKLGAVLSTEQIEQVKNGMTYHVMPITYKAYQDMLPRLTPEEKQYIHAALTEARELAMDAGSSSEKHGWFGKYKGRINNYLSAHGYNMKKESEEWAKRVKEKQTEK